MRRALVLCILAAVPFAACVSALPGGTLGDPDGGSAGSSAPSSGAAGSSAAGIGGMGGRAPGFGGAGPGTGAIAGPGAGGMGATATAGRSGGPGGDGGPGCAPTSVRLASTGMAANIALNIAVAADSVFWIDRTSTSATLVKAPVTGGDPVPLASVRGTSNWVAVDASAVYWSDVGSGNSTDILTVGFDGGTPTPVVSGQAAINRFALGTDGVYWTTPTLGVWKATFDHGPPTMLTPPQNAGEIVVDATNVYWIRVDTSSIMKVANTGGTDPIILAPGQSLPISLALDGQQHLYWVNLGTSAVMRIGIDGSTPPASLFPPGSVKACGGGNVPARSIAVDATGVYWTDDLGNVWVAMPVQLPMAARLLAGGGGGPTAFGIVLDATSAYWMTPSAIWKAAK